MNKKNQTYVDADAVRKALANDVARFDSQAQWCIENQISTAYLSDVLKGRRDPGKKILDVLGMEAVILYRKTASR